mmetsp:Transcript_23193/g.59164  ORF Transcript_23193/g.59164 Transcript_23193/m.59164 type:complete len:360 (+) Transcript_23193:45-1124(+)
MAAGSPNALLARQPYFVLQRMCECLPIVELCRLQPAAKTLANHVRDNREDLLKARRLPAGWPWHKAHVVEDAVFFDRMVLPEDSWSNGPNTKSQGNKCSMSVGEDGEWLWLTGGTDWQGFQGLFRQVSGSGVKPRWLSFQVRVETLAVSGGFLAVSSGQHTWGLQPLLLLFGFRGDDGPGPTRRFKVQTSSSPAAQGPAAWHSCGGEGAAEVESGRPYSVAIHLDWARGKLAVFIDGQEQLREVPFQNNAPIRFLGLYNWRSESRTAFSELLLGRARPFSLAAAGWVGGAEGDDGDDDEVAGLWRRGLRCARRLVPALPISDASPGSSAAAAILVVVAALAFQFWFAYNLGANSEGKIA